MIARGLQAQKGSRRWILRVAEVTAWGTVALVFGLLHSTPLDQGTYRAGLLLMVLMAAWVAATFRSVLPHARHRPLLGVLSMIGGLIFAGATFALLRGEVASIQLTFVPVIVIVGLLTSLRWGLVAAGASAAIYLTIAGVDGGLPSLVSGTLNVALFVLSGSVAGLLARELRFHYGAEQEEHRLATAVRHRLLAVLDSVGEAIVFRDRNGVVRIINARAEELFEVPSDAYLGQAVVELLRTVARQTEDPEGFMETFQRLLDDPEQEIEEQIEQIIPARRQLRLHSRPTFDDDGTLVGRLDVYTDITESVQRAAEVGRLYEQARRTAESYQRGLLPEVPALPRVNVVAHYVPAAGKRAVCGDFYDFVTLGDAREAIVLGDVCGVGPSAANDAALSRYTLRSLARSEADPAKLVQRLNEHLSSQLSPERFVRMVVAVLDPERAQLEYVNAGHVPPVVYRAKSGKVEWLTQDDLVLGVDAGTPYTSACIDLDPGDMLVFYTDGVTESVRLGRPLGQGKLSDIVEEYGVGTPGELAQALRRSVEGWVGSKGLRDDLAMLICQVVPDATIAEPTRELVLPNEPSHIADVRKFVASFLAEVRASVAASQEMLLAVGEAAANASKYGKRPEGRSEVRVRCVLEGPDVTVSVTDEGPGFDPAALEANGLPDRFASGGRGLFLMRQFVDGFEVESSPEGTTVRLTRRVKDDAGA
jgi:serine phosphatase RsbU (regulator of sigma subunit)/anti-sigma regulatory factor (Ser/Thr protein kinase)